MNPQRESLVIFVNFCVLWSLNLIGLVCLVCFVKSVKQIFYSEVVDGLIKLDDRFTSVHTVHLTQVDNPHA